MALTMSGPSTMAMIDATITKTMIAFPAARDLFELDLLPLPEKYMPC